MRNLPDRVIPALLKGKQRVAILPKGEML